MTCSNIGFGIDGNFTESFSGNYIVLRDKPTTVGAPELYETFYFFPNKSLTLTANFNNLISGMALEAPDAYFIYFRADRIVNMYMSVLNGPINKLASPELFHQTVTKWYVGNRFISYTPTEQMNVQFDSL